MSILTKEEILAEIKAKRIEISPFYPECVGPASIDLHLSPAFRIFKSPHKVVRIDNNSDFKKVTYGIWLKKGESILLMPNETILGITEEKIKIPEDICGWIEGRSRFARMGLLIHISAGFMHPGIANHQVLEMSNFGPIPLELVPGIAVCQFIFQKTKGKAKYNGKFKIQTPEDFWK